MSFPTLVRRLKQLAIVMACGVILLANSGAAYAFGTRSSSDVSKGTAQLEEIQQASKDALQSSPRDASEVKEKAEDGLNGVQAKADKSKMKSPSDVNDATTVESKIEAALTSMTE